MRLRNTVLALAGFALAACSSMAPAGRPPPADPTTQLPALERRIYEIVEADREKVNPKATPLRFDSELTGVARAHSQDMATKHYMGHSSPDGETSATIIMARDADYQGLLGENIAAQYYTKEEGIDVDAFAQRFAETWMKSKSHRENLSFPEYQRTGVGAAIDGKMVYVTELFSADLGQSPNAGAPKDDNAQPGGRKVTMFADPNAAKASTPQGHNVRLRGEMGLGMLPGEDQGDGQAK